MTDPVDLAVGGRSLGYPLYTDRGSEIAASYGVQYRGLHAGTAVGSCFLVDREMELRYRWVAAPGPGSQPDPESESENESGLVPPLNEMHAVIRREFAPATETFGLV